ncbi:hypothetical protein OB905_08485 [Halobacteria archaeon AArc-dxtr1]|nr:hypothetical protein [Halobacteria archaeon AArc-dxtr1]
MATENEYVASAGRNHRRVESAGGRTGPVSRRRLLTGLTGAGVAALAGCTGGSDDSDGSDDSGGPGSPGDDGDAGLADVGTNGGDPLEDDFTPGVADGELDELSEAVYFGDVIDYESSFVADLALSSPEPATGFQEVHDGNYYVYIDGSEEIEMYGVGGDLYTVVMGYCDLESRDPEEAQYVPVDLARDDEYASLSAAGTTTVRGEEVYVFEHHITVEYLSTTTGYPVRSEWPNSRADFHSWGEVDPITPPDMPCEGA